MEIKIISTIETLPVNSVKESLESQPNWANTNITLNLGAARSEMRQSIDPTILVAIVGGAAASLTALITGLMALIQSKRNICLEIHGKDGRIIKITGEPSEGTIDMLIEKMQKFEATRIELARSQPSNRQHRNTSK